MQPPLEKHLLTLTPKKFQEIKQAAINEIADIGRRDLYFLTKYILGYDLLQGRQHLEVCDHVSPFVPFDQPIPTLSSRMKRGLWAKIKGKWEAIRKLLLLPRDTFKSTICSIGFPIQLIARDPSVSILLDSVKLSNAKFWLSAIKGHMEFNELFKACYGELRGDKWTEDYITVKGHDRRIPSPTIMTSGVDTSRVSHHVDICILDDPHDEDNCKTPELRAKVIGHYNSLWYILKPPKNMLVPATRYHDEDCINHIINDKRRKFAVLLRQARQKDGAMWFPERISQEEYDAAMETDPFKASCQLQNDPVDEENAVFKPEYIEIWPSNRKLPEGTLCFAAIDPALGKKTSHSDTGLVIVDVTPDDVWIVNRAIRVKALPDEIIETMFFIGKTFKPERMAVEEVAFQEVLQSWFNKERIRRREYSCHVYPCKPGGRSKHVRIMGLEPRFKHGGIFLREGQGDLKKALMRYTKQGDGVYLDILDALAYINDIYFTAEGRPKEKDEEPWSHEKKERMTVKKSLDKIKVKLIRAQRERDYEYLED